MGFQVLFKVKSPLLLRKRTVPNKFPWFKFRSVWTAAFIVLFDSLLQIGGKPDMRLLRILNTPEYIDVVHLFPSLAILCCARASFRSSTSRGILRPAFINSLSDMLRLP